MHSSHIVLLLLTLTLLPIALSLSDSSSSGSDPVIGIDLGTTYSCVAVYRNGIAEIIPNSLGNRVTPSYVAFNTDSTSGMRMVGEAAKNQAKENPKYTFFDIKRLIGRRADDVSVKRDLEMFTFKVHSSKDNRPLLQVEERGKVKYYSPEEISAMLLSNLKRTAEDYLGTNVTRAIVTVPAYFNDAQRHATKDAGKIAGLDVIRIINEPTAAAIAYGIDQSKSQNVVVFDLGGGTFDVSVLHIQEEGGVFEVVATNGNTRLGGEDFDNRLVRHILSLVRKDGNGGDGEPSTHDLQKLRLEVETAKIKLSSHPSVQILLDDFMGKSLNYTISRALFEELNKDLFDQIIPPLKQALEDSKLTVGSIDEIVLVGGSTRIPRVKQMLSEFFGGRRMLHTVNPDEAVGLGAAIQGHQLSGGKIDRDIVLLDVTPLTLGVSIKGGIMRVLMKRNTAVPAKMSRSFTTTKEMQDTVTIKVFEGERPLARQNHHLNTFKLEVPPAPRGSVKVLVTFEVDVNGLLSVTATEQATGQSRTVKIAGGSGRMPSLEIDKKIAESEKYRHADSVLSAFYEARAALERHSVQALKLSRGESMTDFKQFNIDDLSKEDKEDLMDAANRAFAAAKKKRTLDYEIGAIDELYQEGPESKLAERKVKRDMQSIAQADRDLLDTVKQVFSLAIHQQKIDDGEGEEYHYGYDDEKEKEEEKKDTRMYSDDEGEGEASKDKDYQYQKQASFGVVNDELDRVEGEGEGEAAGDPWKNVGSEGEGAKKEEL